MSIQNYLPKKSPHITSRSTVVTGRVPVKVVDEVRVILEKEDLSWAEFLTACCIGFLEERGIKVKEDKK
jgi:hypothetical protein